MYSMLLYGFKLFSLCAGNSIVPNQHAVLEDRPCNCHVEMQELISWNPRCLTDLLFSLTGSNVTGLSLV